MSEGHGDLERRALTLGSIADLVEGRMEGDPDIEVVGVAPVDEADGRQIAFLAARRYARYVPESEAAAFLVSEEMEAALPSDAARVVVDEAHLALRTLLGHFFPVQTMAAAIHRTAVIGRGVGFGEGVDVGPYVVLEDEVRVGAGSRIGAHCVVGRGTSIGERTLFHPHVVVYPGSVIGNDVIVHAGARLGADGFGYRFADGEHKKMPHVGRCVIEDGVEIGANTTIDRGSLGDTVIGRGAKIDNLVQVAHNVRIGALSLVAALVGIAGSTRIGKRVMLGGHAGILNQIEVGDDVRVASASAVLRDVPAGETVSGHPSRPHREELRRQAHLGRLPRLVERVTRLEAEVKRITGE